MKLLKTILICALSIFLIALMLLEVSGDVTPALTADAELPPFTIISNSVEVHLFDTARGSMLEAMTMAQGSIFNQFEMLYGAVLVRHGDNSFLFDAGLARDVDAQFAADMPFLIKPIMSYDKGVAVVDQLRQLPELPQPQRIFLSHVHWDHASGIVDFPQLPVWVPAAERQFVETAKPPAVFPSQVGLSSIKWHTYDFSEQPYAGFPLSLDVFGDGAVVLVNMSGHTPGSVGMFVNSSDGVRRFFVGDAVWNFDAVSKLRSKFWLSALLSGEDSNEAAIVVGRLHALMQANPELKIIPAHDVRVWR